MKPLSKIIVCLLFATGCRDCKSSEDAIAHQGGRAPISCITSGSSKETCSSDGGRRIWLCDTSGVDAECINTNTLPAELP